MKTNEFLKKAKEQNKILQNKQTTMKKSTIQIFNGKKYLFVDYITPLGSNTSIHTEEEHITGYTEWTGLMLKRAKVMSND